MESPELSHFLFPHIILLSVVCMAATTKRELSRPILDDVIKTVSCTVWSGVETDGYVCVCLSII